MPANHSPETSSALARRLGIAPGARVGFVNEPDEFRAAVEPLPAEIRLFERASEPLDVIVYFSDTRANVERRVPLLSNYLAPEATLWLGYPAPSSPTPTDLTRDDVVTIGAHSHLILEHELALGSEWSLAGFTEPPDCGMI